MKQCIVPHPSIDTDASWAKSAYHGWRFGYGLHLLCNQGRFPLCAWVTTASAKEHRLVGKLLANLSHPVGVVVGDAGYRCLKAIVDLEQELGVFIQTPGLVPGLPEEALCALVQLRFLLDFHRVDAYPDATHLFIIAGYVE